MIARHWIGIVKKERADDYIAHLQNDTFKKMAEIKGFSKASILRRDIDGGVEFLIITEWDSIDAIKQFAGDSFETAVVPKIAQDMMISFDPVVSHYDIFIKNPG